MKCWIGEKDIVALVEATPRSKGLLFVFNALRKIFKVYIYVKNLVGILMYLMKARDDIEIQKGDIEG